jgi:hypothetical protein
VVAFFLALGAVIALGNGDVLIGVVGLVLATVLAVGGWILRGYRRAKGTRAD